MSLSTNEGFRLDPLLTTASEASAIRATLSHYQETISGLDEAYRNLFHEYAPDLFESTLEDAGLSEGDKERFLLYTANVKRIGSLYPELFKKEQEKTDPKYKLGKKQLELAVAEVLSALTSEGKEIFFKTYLNKLKALLNVVIPDLLA